MEITEFELERILEQKIAAQTCQNLIGRYLNYQTSCRTEDMLAMWADDPDTRIELPWGVYDGKAGVARYLGELPGHDDEARKGYLRVQALSTPVFEVAKDCQTARGAWFSQGVATEEKEGQSPCRWRWVKLGVDFICQEGEWKLWHMVTHTLIDTAYDKAWYDQPKLTIESFGPDHTPDRKPTWRTLWNMTVGNPYPTGHPAVPRPYDNFDLEVGYGY